MSVTSIGLKTYIWNNNLKSLLLLACFPVLFYLLIWIFFGATDLLAYYNQTNFQFDVNRFNKAGIAGVLSVWHYVLLGVSAWFLVALLFHQSIINSVTKAKFVTRVEQPEIYNMLENLCISRGITMPGLFIINSPALNAYASGISKKNYSITLTSGIVDSLNKDELEAVIAHELTHIMNNDVRLLIVCIIFVGIFSFLTEFAFRSMRFRFGRNRRAAIFLIIGVILIAIGYLLASVLRFSISRKREYLADAGAVELTKKPEAMVSALMKISGNAKIEGVPDEVEQMFIENPPSFFSLFSTHPTIENRIEALKMIGKIDDSAIEAISEFNKDSKGPWSKKRNIW